MGEHDCWFWLLQIAKYIIQDLSKVWPFSQLPSKSDGVAGLTLDCFSKVSEKGVELVNTPVGDLSNSSWFLLKPLFSSIFCSFWLILSLDRMASKARPITSDLCLLSASSCSRIWIHLLESIRVIEQGSVKQSEVALSGI